jgi:DNA polymerase V
MIGTNSFREGPQYGGSAGVRLDGATNYTPHLVKAALSVLPRLFREGNDYHEAGVLLSRLEKQEEIQLPLFSAVPDRERERSMTSGRRGKPSTG